MAITDWGSGGSGLALGQHTVDGNTVEHWELGSDLLGDIGATATDFDTGLARRVYFPGATSNLCTCTNTTTSSDRLMGPQNAGFYTTEITYAALVFLSERPGGGTNRHIWRYESPAPNTDVQVFLTTNPVTGVIQVGHYSTAATFESDTLALSIPVEQWVHLTYTRSAAGNTGKVWVNNTGETWSTTNGPSTANVSGTTQLCLGNHGDGITATPSSFYSLIIKNTEVNDAAVAAMVAEVGL